MITQEYDKCNPWLRKNEIVRMFGLNLGFRYQNTFFYSLSLLMTLILKVSLNFCFALFWERVFLYYFFWGGGVFLRRLTRIKNQKVYKFCCRKSIFFLDTNVLLIQCTLIYWYSLNVFSAFNTFPIWYKAIIL